MVTPETDLQSDEAEFKSELVALIPHLRAFARSLCRNVATAEDIAQEAVMKAWSSRKQYTRGTNLKAWTFMILRNHFYSLKRRDWRQADWDQEHAERTLVSPSSQEDTLRIDELRRAMNRLPDEQREALILIGGGGMSYEEAAEICECAVGTVKSRVSRARKALETILETGDFSSEDDGVAAHDAMAQIMTDADRIARGSAD